MKRLVYSPYVQAYISADSGVVDVSPYITAGSIDRKVNQVSSAQLTLRNPVEASTGKLLWTDGPDGPTFHPMDPIIIVMTRLQGHPTQVFTGYVDKSPYYQMYPGLCTIEASCSLKRLLYTQWDSSLPFSQYFLEQFGWIPDGDTGIVNPTAESKKVKASAGKLQGQFNDSSLGALLFAVLNMIGDWAHSTIWIEALPPQIKSIVLNLYNQIQTEVQTADQQIESLISEILGNTNYGGANPGSTTPDGTGTGGGTVNSPLLNNDQNTFASVVSSGTGLDPNVVAAWLHAEEPSTASEAPNGANNWLNIGAYTGGDWSQLGGNWTTPQGGGNLTVEFLKGTWGGASSGIRAIMQTVNQSPQTQITAIQNSGWASSHYPDLPDDYTEVVQAGGQSVGGASQNGKHGQANANASTSDNPRGVSLAASPFGSKTGNPTVKSQSGRSPGGKTGNANVNATGKMTRLQAIIEAANVITTKDLPYVLGGGHGQIGVPSGSPAGFDCSGAVSAVLGAAGLLSAPETTQYIIGALGGHIQPGLDNSGNGVNIYCWNADHVFMQIEGDYFGTSDGNNGNALQPKGGAGWLPAGTPPDVSNTADYKRYHIPQTILSQTTTYNLALGTGDNTAPGGQGNGPGSTASSSTSGNSSMAAAFSTFINLPGVFNSAEALALTGKRSFIADTPLFPFVEQICQASMRCFMSMPNGNFFAFFPDYFGLFGRQYYWEIHDIEIMDGRIDLSDDPLTTHVAIAGDVFDQGEVNVFDLILTSGIFTIVDAMATGYVGEYPNPSVINISGAQVAAKVTTKDKSAAAQSNQAALNFLQKYGCRPYVEENAAIRSPFFELFLSFQRWMVLWSKQFQTTFELTFMPELFPGGLVAFPEHGLQVYIEEVTHQFDYVNGFTTNVNVSSPSVMPGSSKLRKNISQGVARPSVLQGQASPRGTGTTPTTGTPTKGP